jgi:hypothetical protein
MFEHLEKNLSDASALIKLYSANVNILIGAAPVYTEPVTPLLNKCGI